MNLQEKYNEYKQRQEAKKFFNQNNDYHLSISDYIKMSKNNEIYSRETKKQK